MVSQQYRALRELKVQHPEKRELVTIKPGAIVPGVDSWPYHVVRAHLAHDWMELVVDKVEKPAKSPSSKSKKSAEGAH